MRLLVEGWRFLPHSYSIVNMFQLLELLQIQEVDLRHRDLPHRNGHVPGPPVFDAASDSALRAIREPEAGWLPDVVYRIAFPFDLAPSTAKVTLTYGTTEYRYVAAGHLLGKPAPREALSKSANHIATPSTWAARGFTDSGALESHVHVVPHGVDSRLYFPLPRTKRAALRDSLGWDKPFVFFSVVGAATANKNVDTLLLSFFFVLQKRPDALLVLKGLDEFYGTAAILTQHLKALGAVLPPGASEQLEARIVYIGSDLTFSDMAQLYQLADCYVAPYGGEGFNMPVLEAAACGLPVICSAGGSTDDFVHSSFAQTIPTRIEQRTLKPGEDGFVIVPRPEDTFALMMRCIEDTDWMTSAREAGPAWVQDQFTWNHAARKLVGLSQRLLSSAL